MTKEQRKIKKVRRKPARISKRGREEIFHAALKLMAAPARPEASDILLDFWDPEIDPNFRPGLYASRPNQARALCERLISTYAELVREERAASVAPSTISTKLERFRSALLGVAGEMERTSQSEYRVIVQAAPKDGEDFAKEIIPLKWPGPNGESQLSRLLRAKADAFGKLLDAIRQGHEHTAWSKENRGRGRNLLRWLQVASPAWQLIHMSWRVFEDLGCPLLPVRRKEELKSFHAYIHELATGESDIEFKGELARYMKLRLAFDPLARVLRGVTAKYGLENFYQLEDYVQRRLKDDTNPRPHMLQLVSQIEEYRSIRRQLVSGPDPFPRHRKGSKNY